jgi:hypothetical protein
MCTVLLPPGVNPIAVNPLNAELNPMCNLLALLRAHHIFHVSRLRVNKYINISKAPKLKDPFE